MATCCKMSVPEKRIKQDWFSGTPPSEPIHMRSLERCRLRSRLRIRLLLEDAESLGHNSGMDRINSPLSPNRARSPWP